MSQDHNSAHYVSCYELVTTGQRLIMRTRIGCAIGMSVFSLPFILIGIVLPYAFSGPYNNGGGGRHTPSPPMLPWSQHTFAENASMVVMMCVIGGAFGGGGLWVLIAVLRRRVIPWIFDRGLGVIEHGRRRWQINDIAAFQVTDQRWANGARIHLVFKNAAILPVTITSATQGKNQSPLVPQGFMNDRPVTWASSLACRFSSTVSQASATSRRRSMWFLRRRVWFG